MRGLLVALALGLGSGASAQQAMPQPQVGIPQSAVVVLDRDALYQNSRFGQRVARDIEAASDELSQENRAIEAALEAEEQALTARRANETPDAFRQLAAAFDTRVNEIRATQDAKARAITQQNERAQAIFFEQANPVLVDLARETGALVILDRRFVLASSDQVDITALAAERVDAVLGEGEQVETAPPQPRPVPDAPAVPEESPAPDVAPAPDD
ncbi:OmpH family outer membrane protein [uncultured Jannaschia sp.]|uniref:OmpH family outer membrane protein n=1 Tax=uncultured Jannaschia sp. TaxID=293347 RepID=UPI00263811A2|nr:OmpH family outer membrane protein [uncultured Jannaschia sp.]